MAIDGEKIVAVASAGTFGSDSTRRLIDATGKIVMPGGIDPHVHCKWYSPHPDGGVTYTDPPSVVSRAALFGGTTTLFAALNTLDGAVIGQCLPRQVLPTDHQSNT